MPLTGQAKVDYQRHYMRRKRNGSKPRACSFCDEPGTPDRLLVGDDENCTICEACITLAVARIAEARGR
jgi:ClpX C4-type zinc finger